MPLLIDTNKNSGHMACQLHSCAAEEEETQKNLLDTAEGLYTAGNVMFTSVFHALPSSMRQRTC
eukprot:5837542-Ditylum_brightwellii.AAC.1